MDPEDKVLAFTIDQCTISDRCLADIICGLCSQTDKYNRTILYWLVISNINFGLETVESIEELIPKLNEI